MGRGLAELNVAGGAESGVVRRGRKPTEARVTAIDIRAALADAAPVTQALESAAKTVGSQEAAVISMAMKELQYAERLAQAAAPAKWEQAELLLDTAMRRLGPVMASRGATDPLARRFLMVANRDARRRGHHQVGYLAYRGLLSKTQADIMLKNVDKIVRAGILRGDKTSIALSVLERSERACERLGTAEEIEKSPARQQTAKFIQGIAQISGGYLQMRMSRNDQTDETRRARSEAWLETKAFRQVQIAQAVASGLALRSTESATTKLVSSGALPGHQRMLINIFGHDRARQESAGQWIVLSNEAYEQAKAATGSKDRIVRVPGLGSIISEDLAREILAARQEQKLSTPLMKSLIERCLPKAKPSTKTHPAVIAVSEGFRQGLVESLAEIACGMPTVYDSENALKWSYIIQAAARNSMPHAHASVIRDLARAPESQRLKMVAKLVCGREDASAQRIVLQVAMQLAKSPYKNDEAYLKLCADGWHYARAKAAERNVLGSV